MSKSLISTGINPNDGNGDTLLAGATKVNSNFNEVYSAIGDGSNINVGSGKTVISTNSSGYVGIGTTNATSPFQVYIGPAVIGSASSTGTASQTLQVTGGAYVSGNLGVGITNPSNKLDVIGVARVGLASTAIVLGSDAGRNIDIGVGSTNLDTYIDFYGTPTYSDYAARLIRSTGDNSNFSIINRGTGSLRLVTQDAGNIQFLTNNIERVRIDSSGNVGIGTTNPITQHHVVGNQYVTGISTVGLAATSLPPNNSQMSFELLTNTKLRIKVKGTDGVLRMVDLTLS